MYIQIPIYIAALEENPEFCGWDCPFLEYGTCKLFGENLAASSSSYWHRYDSCLRFDER